MKRRQSNDPKRRILPPDALSNEQLIGLAGRLRYVGASYHKLYRNDYGLIPPFDPRPSKSPCDDLRPIPLQEARDLFRRGIEKGMISALSEAGSPKFVWCVDEAEQVYEAKTNPNHETDYHGYRLSEADREMRALVLREWRQR